MTTRRSWRSSPRSHGDQGAWDEIVDRYAPLVSSMLHRVRMSNHDIEDVAQNVWLLLVGQLGTLPPGRAARVAGHDHTP